MGIPISLLKKTGLTGVESFVTQNVYQRFFREGMDINSFQLSFTDFYNELNVLFPGKHYKAPLQKDIKKFFDEWKGIQDEDAKKKKLIEFMKDNVKDQKPNETATMITGMVAPPAAVFLKKTGENTPQLKKFRLHLIPNFVFVPTCTLIALAGVRILQLKSTTPPETSTKTTPL